MKIVDKINEARRNQTPVYSFEFFPPKTEDSVANLYDRMGRMAQLEPTFISCTWGAGGSTSEKTLDICATAQSVYGLETVMHLTCTNMEKEKLDKALKEAKNAGINNILALRGDPPRGQEYWTACDSRFSYASDLVKYIREQYGNYFCIGVAGYPEGHVDSTDKSMDLQHLKAKIDAGADFIVSQLFYDISAFEAWVKSCREIGIKVPIIAGVMPIPTYQIFRRIINLCKINVPRNIMETLDGIRSDDQKVKEYGVHLATEMVKRLASNDQVSGIHFTTLNLERSPKLVLQELKWLKESAAKTKSTKVPLAWAPGGDPTRAENWDEFPNGRYGDARSPAFGENLLSASQLQPTSAAASKWGHPEKTSDITALFEKYINGKLGSLPWCEEPLQTETDSIRQQLCELNRNGYWTVASQPAVNGAKSEDPVYGWGPKGGYVYQKAFLEFFVSDTQLSALLEKLDQDASITYYATNSLGALKTNMKDPKAQNAVTWGVFPGKEIVQPTIIELISFEAWRDEAFALWADWQRQYPPNSPSAKLLKDISENYWLVNVVHNDYQQSDGLFKAILS